MSLVEELVIDASARLKVLERRDEIQRVTYTTVTVGPPQQGTVLVQITGTHREDLRKALNRVERAAHAESWGTKRAAQDLPDMITALRRYNVPNFRKDSLRGLRFTDLGLARTGNAGQQGRVSASEVVSLFDSPLPVLFEIDDLEVALKYGRGNRQANRERFVNLCAIALEWLTGERDNVAHASERIVFFRGLSTDRTLRETRDMLGEAILDIIHLRRGSADNTISPRAFVIFASVTAAKAALDSQRITCEPANDFNQFIDSWNRRLLVLKCIVDGIQLSGQAFRSSQNKYMRRHIYVRNRTAADTATNAVVTVAADAVIANAVPATVTTGTAADVASAAATTVADTATTDAAVDTLAAASSSFAGTEKTAEGTSYAAVIVKESTQSIEHDEMETTESDEGFVIVGLDRDLEEPSDLGAEFGDFELVEQEEPEALSLPTDQQHEEQVRVRPKTTYKVDNAAFRWHLQKIFKHRYAPDSLKRGRKAKYTEYEDVQVTEQAFWRTLDILWEKQSFREEMTQMLTENDQRYGRNNMEKLLKNVRPRNVGYDGYSNRDPDVLVVPRSYRKLYYIFKEDGLLETTEYLLSLRDSDWLALDTEGGSCPNYGPTTPVETIQFATAERSYVVDARQCAADVPLEIFNAFLRALFANPSLKFGMDFDQADVGKIMALLKKDDDDTCSTRTAIRRAVVYDIRQLVRDTYQSIGLARYVIERPRLSNYVYFCLKKKMNKAYTCSMWDHRPYLDEQLVYAHLDVICIILLVKHCSEKAEGREAINRRRPKKDADMSDSTGNEAYVDYDELDGDWEDGLFGP